MDPAKDKSEYNNIDAHIQKQKAIRFLYRQQEGKQWIEEMIGKKLPPGTANFCPNLRDGVILCELSNSFLPNFIKKIHRPKIGTVMEFMAIDNLTNFFRACEKVGLMRTYIFEVTDLWEGKNYYKVVHTVHSLARYLAAINWTTIRIQNLSNVKLEFQEEEIEQTMEQLKEMEEISFDDLPDDGGNKNDQSEDVDTTGDLADPDQCILEGESLNEAVAGQEKKFLVVARDSKQNPIPEGGEIFSCTLYNKKQDTVKISASVKDLDTGKYEFKYTPEKSGTYSMEVYLHDEPEEDDGQTEKYLIKGCPMEVNVTTGKVVEPSKCDVSGIGAETAIAGVATKFNIVAKDKYGNEGVMGQQFEAELIHDKSGKKVNVQVTENADSSSYDAEYLCPQSGKYTLNVYNITDGKRALIRGDGQNSTLKIHVKDAGISDPTKSVVQGSEALVGEEAETRAGSYFELTIVAKDKHGNERSSGGEKFKVELVHKESGETKEIQVNDNNDGKYAFTLHPQRDGDYELKVSLDGKDVEGYPLEFNVQDTGVTDPTKCSHNIDSNFTTLRAGEEKTINVQARDRFGNKRREGGENFMLNVVSKRTMNAISTKRIQKVDNQDGTYDLTFSVEKAGDYVLEVLHSYAPIGTASSSTVTSPTETPASPKADSSDEASTEEETQKETLTNDVSTAEQETNTETLTADDENKTETEDIEAGEEETKESTSTADESNAVPTTGESKSKKGLLSKFKNKMFKEFIKAGEMLNQSVNITGFPLDVKVIESGETDPDKTRFEGEGLNRAVSNQESKFKVITCDKFGNERVVGGDQIKVLLVNRKRKIKFEADIEDLEDGSYQVTYTPTQSGNYDVEVFVNEAKVNLPPEFEEKMKLFVEVPEAKELSEKELVHIHQHDLLTSLMNTFVVEQDNENLTQQIAETREKLIKQIRLNTNTETDLKSLERKIQLLVNNRIQVEQLLNERKKKSLFKRKKKSKKGKTDAENASDEESLTGYSELFYLLQTDPKYLANMLYLVKTEEVDTFLKTVILTVYGYAFSPREEYLMLNLFRQTLQLEIAKGPNFLKHNPVLPTMVLNYGRRAQGMDFLKNVMWKNYLEPLYLDKTLNLDVQSEKIYKKMISDQEVKSGVKSDVEISKISYEVAMNNKEVRELVESRINKLQEVCDSILNGMIKHVDDIPYGLRWVCKQLDKMLKEKYEEETLDDRSNKVGYIIYYRFINPVVVSPDKYDLLDKKVAKKMSMNTVFNMVNVSKCLLNLVTNYRFKSDNEHLMLMNDWINTNRSKYIEQFVHKLVDVEEPEDFLGVNEYMELALKKTPTITITYNEMYNTHRLISKYISKLTGDNKDEPLYKVYQGLGEVPELASNENNDEISLPLLNKFAEESVTKAEKLTPAQKYEETKNALRIALRAIPSEYLGDNLLSTLKKAEEFAEMSIEKGEKIEENKEILEKIQVIQKYLPELDEAKLVSAKDGYRKILVDITKELQNQKFIRQRQKKDLEKLKESLKSLQIHYNHLSKRIEEYEAYITDTFSKQFQPQQPRGGKAGRKRKDRYKFSYKQLKEKGVIKQLKVGKPFKKKIKFIMAMTQPGVFEIEATMLSISKKETISMVQLLEMQERGKYAIDNEYVELDVNMLIHMLNKLFGVSH